MFRPLLLAAVLLFFVSSCAYHRGTLAGGNAVITDSTASVSRTAYGYAQTLHILGMGGQKKDALLQEAKRNLRANSRLETGEALGQTSVNFKTQFFLVGWKTQVILAADVIDFKPSEKRNAEGQNHSSIKSGEEVYFLSKGNQVKGCILEVTSDYYRIQYIDNRGHLKIDKIAIKKTTSHLKGKTAEELPNTDKEL